MGEGGVNASTGLRSHAHSCWQGQQGLQAQCASMQASAVLPPSPALPRQLLQLISTSRRGRGQAPIERPLQARRGLRGCRQVLCGRGAHQRMGCRSPLEAATRKSSRVAAAQMRMAVTPRAEAPVVARARLHGTAAGRGNGQLGR